MITNQFKKVLTVVVAVIMFTGCDALLNIDPQQSISDTEALETPENVQSLLVGGYRALGFATMYAGGIQFMSDLVADPGEVRWTGTFFDPREAIDKRFEADNGYVGAIWRDAYTSINRVNNVLTALDVVTNQNDRRRIEGEAKFVRALNHFTLVTHFGKYWNDGNPATNPGIPLLLRPPTGADFAEGVGRSTVAAVYESVIQDLLDAKELLPVNNSFFANTYVASAFLVRVYMSQQQWALAAAEANRVITSDRFSLVPAYENVFNNASNTTEDVFAIQITAQVGTSRMNQFYASQTNGGRGDIDIQQSHLDLYEPGDERRDLFYADGSTHRTGKWNNNIDGNIQIIRLAEMYLSRAEANFHLRAAGQSMVGNATPEDDISTIRQRVGLNPVNNIADINVILNERKLELAFEGDAFHTLKRSEGTTRDVDGVIPWNANRLVYPIPQREIDSNPALAEQQNPGY